MADAKKCDRCGKFYEGNEVRYSEKGLVVCNKHYEYDLCEDCLKDLDEFMILKEENDG